MGTLKKTKYHEIFQYTLSSFMRYMVRAASTTSRHRNFVAKRLEKNAMKKLEAVLKRTEPDLLPFSRFYSPSTQLAKIFARSYVICGEIKTASMHAHLHEDPEVAVSIGRELLKNKIVIDHINYINHMHDRSTAEHLNSRCNYVLGSILNSELGDYVRVNEQGETELTVLGDLSDDKGAALRKINTTYDKDGHVIRVQVEMESKLEAVRLVKTHLPVAEGSADDLAAQIRQFGREVEAGDRK